MTKTEMREMAKDKLMEAIAVAYYRLENENLIDEEMEQISAYINQYGEAMGKRFIEIIIICNSSTSNRKD